jgi:hypothetical protein
MFRDLTPGRETIWFWLGNHGTPVESNSWYAPQLFGLQWVPELTAWPD